MFKACMLTWVGGLVAGLLLRSTSGHHGLVAAVVLVAVNAGIGGAVLRMLRAKREGGLLIAQTVRAWAKQMTASQGRDH